MRKSSQVAVSTGLLCAAAASLVWAVQPGEVSFVPRAYMTANFGGTTQAARQNNFFYGMRLDRDATFDTSNLNLPPVVQLAFDRYGMSAASLYGMPFAQRKLALNQTEGEAASGTTYTAIDWTLLALGAIGIGYTISEVVNQKDTPDAPSSGGGGAAAGGGGTATGGGGTATGGGGTATGGGGTATGGGGTATGGGGTATGGFTTQSRSTPLDHQHDSASDAIEEYQKWLDGGTGQMGDLESR